MKLLSYIVLILGLVANCENACSESRSVYILVDKAMEKDGRIDQVVRYLLRSLGSGDALAISMIDHETLIENNNVIKIVFDMRPARANVEKRLFNKIYKKYIQESKANEHSDITGGVLRAVQNLNDMALDRKYILIFSDLSEDIISKGAEDFPVLVNDVVVLFLDVSELLANSSERNKYFLRSKKWQERVEKGGGSWGLFGDVSQFHELFN